MAVGDVLVAQIDHSCAMKNVPEWARNQGYNVEIEEVDDGYAKCSLEIQPHHLNAANTVMGGAIFTLADFAFAVATFGLLDFTDTFPFPKYAIYDVLEK